ncbi:MAG: ribose-phosphate pyrophosphokinase [Clostridia bacterium]|nr:ribose-phosphate pyrophosphokinase [Clostridia bacterium]
MGEIMNGHLNGELKVIGMRGCEEFTKQVDHYLKQLRGTDKTFIVDAQCPRFGSGEAKALISESMRGIDLYIISDCFNYGVTYKMYGMQVPMSPDDHFQDLKRVIAATGGKPRRISVIMPMLYEGRQHKRSARESLDCALALQELTSMGVTNIITFDAHDPRVQNAIPLSGFDNVRPAYQMLKALVRNVPEVKLDKENIMVVSPDEGAIGRSMYIASVLGIELGMFYKRRNYSIIIDGKNPIEAHEYLGNDLTGKDVIVVDDMISSGDSMIDVAMQLKERGAKRVFVFATFALFCNGLEKFDKAYEEGIFDKIFATNLTYHTKEILSREWYCDVNMSKYVSYLIDTINLDESISSLLNPVQKIHALLDKHND